MNDVPRTSALLKRNYDEAEQARQAGNEPDEATLYTRLADHALTLERELAEANVCERENFRRAEENLKRAEAAEVGASYAVLSSEAQETLADALTALLDHYTQLVNSGDAGNWDPEEEPVVIGARDALAVSAAALAQAPEGAKINDAPPAEYDGKALHQGSSGDSVPAVKAGSIPAASANFDSPGEGRRWMHYAGEVWDEIRGYDHNSPITSEDQRAIRILANEFEKLHVASGETSASTSVQGGHWITKFGFRCSRLSCERKPGGDCASCLMVNEGSHFEPFVPSGRNSAANTNQGD